MTNIISKKNKNICVASWYNALNYGTCLQSYALVKILSDMGFNAYIPETFKYFYYDFFSHPIVTIKRIFELLLKKCIKTNQENKYIEEYKLRQKKINNFVNLYNSIYPVKSYNDYKQMCQKSDIFLTGSDQIWNPYILREAFLLTFVKDNKRKASYASSIGVEKIPAGKKKIYKKALSTFYKIGVREKSAQKELAELLNREITTVLDPVYLLQKEDWEKLLVKNNTIPINHNYIFCYFVGMNDNWIKDIKLLSKNYNLPLYTLTGESRFTPAAGKVYAGMGVEEFLTFIHNAGYVITDSFHAIAFSIIFNKNFTVYRRFKDNDKSSQNSRIYDILNLFGLADRLVSSYQDLKILKSEINYKEVNRIILSERKKSIDFLKEALDGNEQINMR